MTGQRTRIGRTAFALAVAGLAASAARAVDPMTGAPPTTAPTRPRTETTRNPITGAATVTHGVFEDDDNGPATRPAGAAGGAITGTVALPQAAAAAPTTAPALADANGRVDNPVYTAWAKLKPDSTLTWTSDMVGPTGQPTHMVATLTIKEVTADGVKIEAASESGGQKMPADAETIPAKVPADAVQKRDGQEKVKATIDGQEKEYTCDVYEISSAAMGTKGGGDNQKITAYASPDAPGGLVKMTAKLPWGKDGSINLTGADVK